MNALRPLKRMQVWLVHSITVGIVVVDYNRLNVLWLALFAELKQHFDEQMEYAKTELAGGKPASGKFCFILSRDGKI